MSISSCGCPLWHLKGAEIIPWPRLISLEFQHVMAVSFPYSYLVCQWACISLHIQQCKAQPLCEQLLLRELLRAPAMGRRRLRTKWRAFTCGCVQNESCSQEYFQEQQSSYETACYGRQYLDRRPHSGWSAVAATAASAASASTRDRLCWQAKGSRFHPNRISQDKFNFIIFS